MKFTNLHNQARQRLVIIRKDRLVLVPFLGTATCIVIGLVLIFFMQRFLPNTVPLFYSLPRASERLVNKELLVILPGAAGIIFIVNFLGIFFFTTHDKVLSRILAVSTILAAILSLYSLVRIIFLIA